MRDMSVEGIFVLSTVGPPLGARVDIEIAKAEEWPQRLKSFIKARMNVVRIDRKIDDERASGFAAHGKVFVGRSVGKKTTTRSIQGPFVATDRHALAEIQKPAQPKTISGEWNARLPQFLSVKSLRSFTDGKERSVSPRLSGEPTRVS